MARRIRRTSRVSPKPLGSTRVRIGKKTGIAKKSPSPFGTGPISEPGWTEADPHFVQADPRGGFPGTGGNGDED